VTDVTFDFAGRHAFVTGAGGGIGLQVASDLVRAGCHVVAFDMKPDPGDLPSGPGRLEYVQGDLGNAQQVADAIGVAAAERLDFVVNAGGIALWYDTLKAKDGSIVDIDMGVWEKTMTVNLLGSVHVARAAVPHMIEGGGGSLVFISSVVGARSMDNLMKSGPIDAYQVSKAGVISLSRTLALTYGPKNIRSNTVCPGAVWTPMTASIYEDPVRVKAMEERTPLLRIGRPADISNACLFLLSDRASFVTATDMMVDGGLMAKVC